MVAELSVVLPGWIRSAEVRIYKLWGHFISEKDGEHTKVCAGTTEMIYSNSSKIITFTSQPPIENSNVHFHKLWPKT